MKTVSAVQWKSCLEIGDRLETQITEDVIDPASISGA